VIDLLLSESCKNFQKLGWVAYDQPNWLIKLPKITNLDEILKSDYELNDECEGYKVADMS